MAARQLTKRLSVAEYQLEVAKEAIAAQGGKAADFRVEVTDTRWVIEIDEKPTSLNKERGQMRQMQRHNDVKKWRAYGKAIALKLPTHPGQFGVETFMTYPNRRHRFDVGNWLPSVKAVIDGIIDSERLAEDNDDVMTFLHFERGRIDRDRKVPMVTIEVVLQ